MYNKVHIFLITKEFSLRNTHPVHCEQSQLIALYKTADQMKAVTTAQAGGYCISYDWIQPQCCYASP